MTAFLLTWKESGWPHENIVRMVETLGVQGYVDEPWRIAAHKMAKPGDAVWVLKQGRGPKGIFGSGQLTGPAAPGEAGNGKTQWMAPVRFHAFVDPRQRLLIDEQSVGRILRATQLRAQASGYPLDDQQADALRQEIGAPVELGGSGDWKASELQAIVADYFSMLDDELAGRPYSKMEHREKLCLTVHRSAGSIERKHQNISAVLQELGLPWIDGYKPLGNFQDALLSAVEARLDHVIGRLDDAKPKPAEQTENVFVSPPTPARLRVPHNGVGRMVGKFDPAGRDAANRQLGNAGEEFVAAVEARRLTAAGRPDLAATVNWVSKNTGDGLGYDIESYEADGRPLHLEVKTTRGSITTPFYISENEIRFARENAATFRLYRVFDYGSHPRIFVVKGPLQDTLLLEPVCYRASIAPAG